ncbi:MAG: hypothetical protein QOK42_1967 [Frankiaceae bacterium]|nr:hypothetical protein [Frankiaceae bacterium]
MKRLLPYVLEVVVVVALGVVTLIVWSPDNGTADRITFVSTIAAVGSGSLFRRWLRSKEPPPEFDCAPKRVNSPA